MNLMTHYMGLQLRSPLVVSASPLSEKVSNIRQMEDAGAGAVVLFSLFEEQLRNERLNMYYHSVRGSESHAEAITYAPQPFPFRSDSHGYLELIAEAKRAVDIPIIGSLNGTSLGSWIRMAKQIEQAGADALELNLYTIPTETHVPGVAIEERDLDIVEHISRSIQIPVAVKLSPYFSNLANMAKRFHEAGATGLVLFNRFYQPDIDLETLEVRPNVILSTPEAARLPLRWIAILYGRVPVSFAATSGVHSGEDVVKLLLAGASVTMMASALLRNGIGHLRVVEDDLKRWMAEREYESVLQMRGALSQLHSDDPTAFERAQYMRALSTFQA